MATRYARNENFVDVATEEEMARQAAPKYQGVASGVFFSGDSLEKIILKAGEEITEAMRGNKKASSLAAINLPAFIVVRAVRIYICSEVWKGKVKGYQVTWKPLV